MIFVGILVVLNVVVAIDGATSGTEIAQIQKQEAVLADAKKVLQGKLVTGLSMGNLQEKSTELGFVKPENPIYLSGAPAVAKLP